MSTTHRLSLRRCRIGRTLTAAAVAIVAGTAMVATSVAQPAGNRPPRGGAGQGQMNQRQGGPGGNRQGNNGQQNNNGRPQPGRGGPAEHALSVALGVSVRPIPPEQGSSPNEAAKPATGLIVESVQPNSAAATAGLVQGDHLTRLGDQIIVNTPQLVTLLALQDEGASVTLDVERQGDAAMHVTLSLDQTAIDCLRRGAHAGPPPHGGPGQGNGNGHDGNDGPPPPPDGNGGPDGNGPPPPNN